MQRTQLFSCGQNTVVQLSVHLRHVTNCHSSGLNENQLPISKNHLIGRSKDGTVSTVWEARSYCS